MIVYLLKTTLSLVVLLLLYALLLQGLKMPVYKRFYLLTALVVSLIFPLLTLSTTTVPWANALPAYSAATLIIDGNSTETAAVWNTTRIFGFIYGLGALFFLLRFIVNLCRLHRLQKGQHRETVNGIHYVFSNKIAYTFAFWNRIYLPKNQFSNLDFANEIILHEITHIRQRHSLDILFIELLKILFWFNPIFYYYKKAIALNHEFLADESVVATTKNSARYLQILLQQQRENPSQLLSSSFYYQPTKKRFIMATKTVDPKKNIQAKGLATLLLAGIALTSMQAKQHSNPAPPTANTEFAVPDKNAEFPGGHFEFGNYFIRTFQYPTPPDQPIKLIFQFVVEEDGSTGHIRILKGFNDEMNHRVIDVIKNSPLWKPAEKDGKKIPSLFTIPITIQAKDENQANVN
ncbi:M56 family metallopeptidase [Flavobacterium sp. JP2137]|uniref:M56 family metallopeptidase n=1 Tax=Flavobacterium sp. JP2137 TaxID=3414510 RepID=UPI003D300F6E